MLIFVGAKFVSVCGGQKAERSFWREVPNRGRARIPTSFSVGSLKPGNESGMAAVTSIAEANNARSLVLIQEVTSSAFV